MAIPQPVDLAPWLDPEVARAAGGTQLRGSLNLASVPGGVKAEELDVRLGDARLRGGLAYRPRETGGPTVLAADDFRVDVGGSWVRADRGWIDLASNTLDVVLHFGSEDLPRWLRRYRQPLIAQAAAGSGHVSGSFDAPVVTSGAVQLRGVPVLGAASATGGYRGGVLSIGRAAARSFGGKLVASGRLRLAGRTPRLLGAQLDASGLELARIPGLEQLATGTASLHATAEGPIDAPLASFSGGIDDLTVAGESYRDVALEGSSDASGGSLRLQLERARGGRLSLDASVNREGELSGDASITGVPLQTLPGVLTAAGNPLLGGNAEAQLQLHGTVWAPTVEGSLSIEKSWFKDSFLGAADLRIERTGDGRMRLAGSLFQGAFWVNGELQTQPTVALRLDLGFRRVNVDQFFPELAADRNARGWVSGEIRNLVLAADQPTTFELRITEMVLQFEHEDDDGRPRPLRVRSIDELELDYDGATARLLRPARIEGPTGETLTVSGSLSTDRVALRLEGEVAAALVQPYVSELFDEAEGTLAFSVELTGPLDDIDYTGVLGISDVVLRPSGQDAEVRIPAAKLQINNDQVVFTGFTVEVADEITGERDELSVQGSVAMDDFVPTRWALIVYGNLSGKLLLIVAPDAFTAASGSAEVEIWFEGSGLTPNINGTLAFSQDHPLTFTPRGLRREILLDRGSVNFTDQLVELEQIGGTIDDSGVLTDLSGTLSIQDWQPVGLDIRVNAQTIPFRIPRTLELDADLDGLRIVSKGSQLEIAGRIDIIDGRYLQKFNPLLDALRPERIEEAETPIYEQVPQLGDARLNLIVSTGGRFGIKNNIADIDLDGTVTITGTPRRPRVDGEVTVQQGSFKFQGMRARFDRTEGSIVFSRFQRFPEDTPYVDIRSEATYLDSRGTQHDVVLELTGTLRSLNWDLYTTNTGLNKSQTASLLISGRTTEENRSLLGDEPIAPTRNSSFDQKSTAPTESQLDAFDQLAKDYLGDFISALVEDPLRNATGLDVVRIEVGTAGVAGRVEENIGKNTKVIGEFEQTLRGRTVSGKLELRIRENLSLELEYLYKVFFEDLENNVNGFRGKGTYRKKIE